MPKMKTHKGAAKRFRFTGTGKLVQSQGRKGHFRRRKAGRLLQLGTPREIYARPANRFVADFVGSPRINVLPARLVHDHLPRAVIGFDGVALAQYRHGADSVGFHRDREMRWLEDTVIGVLTFGARRPFLLRPIGERRSAHDDDMVADAGATFDLAPAGGDLIVMGGRCQADWLHAVPKVHDVVVGPRISAQYRWTSRKGRPDIQPGFRAPRFYSR